MRMARLGLALCLAAFTAQSPDISQADDPSATSGALRGAAAKIKHVFVIVMENHNWSDVKGSPSAPYLNKKLLPQSAGAEKYSNAPSLHPSEPNYLWMEAGTNFGIHSD